MRLGNLQLNNNLVLAPMAGITDYPFRQLAREMGCDLTVTEMVSAEGLLRKGDSFLKMVEGEHPVSVQIFGSKPDVLAEAAAKAEAMGADAIDLNMGCPAKQVVKTGAGVDLMRFPEKVEGILIAMRKRVACPLTVKIRSGWDEKQINAVEISKLAEDCGLDAITVHPRTRTQGFRGRADWSVIAAVKRAVRIPVIGNGDVNTTSLIKRMIEETGCDGVMIGRGALGTPWVFNTRPSGPPDKGTAISLEERKRVIHRHLSLIQNYYEERNLTSQIRKHLYWYTKGLPNCAAFHSQLSSLKGKEKLLQAFHSYFDSIQRREPCQRSVPEEDRSITGWVEKVL
ncbi:MAG: tRNA dihydrouridine synthase DusB [Deltaproteobacteria bacterium]|nr:tRNA dihydrouridine synthase DusB [Deltaproteobacteria bacterium]